MGKKLGRPKKKENELARPVCFTLYPWHIEALDKLIVQFGYPGNRSEVVRVLIDKLIADESSEG